MALSKFRLFEDPPPLFFFLRMSFDKSGFLLWLSRYDAKYQKSENNIFEELI